MDAGFTIMGESFNNVDLFVESERHAIVIEDKIRPGINGIDGDYSQLVKYREKTKKHVKSLDEPVRKSSHYYIFAPDYSTPSLRSIAAEEGYAVMPYSTLRNFFTKHAASYVADEHFPGFLMGLARHTMSMSELQHQTMRTCFLRKINQSR